MENKKLNVLFISSWYPNKYKPLLGIFVKRLAEANSIHCNVSAIYVCSGDSNLVEESVDDGIYTLRGYYKRTKTKLLFFSKIVHLSRYLLMWRNLLLLYKKQRGMPDIINSNIVYPVSIIATVLKFTWWVPYVITEHWTGYFPEDGRYKGIAKKIISKIAVANAKAVVTDSCKLSKMMTSLALKNNYFVVPNVVNPEEFKLSTPRSDGYFNFIHISSFDDEQKNVTGIISAFKKFHPAHPLSKLTIIGGEESKELLDKIKRYCSEDRSILLLGNKTGSEYVSCLQKADALLLFSNYENLPCVMLEAFCCGVPVIATKVGDMPQYITEKNGIIIEPKNEDQLIEAMKTMYSRIKNYNPLEIRNRIVDKVTPAVVSKQYNDIYKMI